MVVVDEVVVVDVVAEAVGEDAEVSNLVLHPFKSPMAHVKHRHLASV